jgi:hypothetical protein
MIKLNKKLLHSLIQVVESGNIVRDSVIVYVTAAI